MCTLQKGTVISCPRMLLTLPHTFPRIWVTANATHMRLSMTCFVSLVRCTVTLKRPSCVTARLASTAPLWRPRRHVAGELPLPSHALESPLTSSDDGFADDFGDGLDASL